MTFVADKNDSAKTVSIPLSIQKLDASVSWNRQTSSLSVVVPEARSSVQIFDVLGNCVYRNASLVKGANEVRPGLKAGFYAVRVQSGVRQTILNINVKE